MRKVLIGLVALPFMAGIAMASERLSEKQLDGVTAGFTSISIADAEGLVGESGAVLTTTAGLSLVVPFAKASAGEISSTLFKSLSASQSSTVTTTYNPLAIPGVLGQ